MLLGEHLGVARRGVRVVMKQIPAAEYQIVQLRERHEVADQRCTRVGAFAEADVAELRERSDRLRLPAPSEHRARDEGRRDGAHSGQQYTQLAVCSCDLGW